MSTRFDLDRAVEAAKKVAERPAAPLDVEALQRRADRVIRTRRIVRGAGIAVAVVALVLGGVMLRPKPVEWSVDGAALADSGFVQAGPAQRATLRFSDQSEIVLEASSSAHVVDRRPTGATIRLASGRAEVAVVHRASTSWRVEPGPFVVHVTGTRFSAQWRPEQDEAVVELHEGEVRIEGPGVPSPVTLRAGQRFVASVRAGAVRYEVSMQGEARPEPPGPPPAPVAPELPVSPEPVDAGVRSGRPVPRALALSDWQGLLARGEFEAITNEASRIGVEVVLSRGSVEDVLRLADAARYQSMNALALRAFERAHQRLKAGPQSAVAAFRLGQLLEATDEIAAEGWFRRALEEDETGPLTAEALARRMLIARRRGSPEARALAERYLRQFPTGPAAGVARTLSP